MEKPILATNIDGFLIKHDAFIEPHTLWFDRVISLTGDKTLDRWKGSPNYFKGVDIAMAKLMPEASDEERTKQARDWYQQEVVTYIRFHKEVVYQKAVQALRALKSKFTLALITTNAEEHIRQILEAAGISDLYDIVFAIPSTEKPDKASLFQRFVEKHGSPGIYIAARSKEAFEECIKLGNCLCVYANWDESDKEIEKLSLKQIKEPEELSALINSIK